MNNDVHSKVQWLFSVAIAVILLCIVGIAAIMKESAEDRAYIRPVSKLLLLISLIILLVPIFSQYLTPLSFLSIVAVILLVPVTVGIKSWVNYKFFSNN